MCSYLQASGPQTEVRIFPFVMALFFYPLKKYSLVFGRGF